MCNGTTNGFIAVKLTFRAPAVYYSLICLEVKLLTATYGTNATLLENQKKRLVLIIEYYYR